MFVPVATQCASLWAEKPFGDQNLFSSVTQEMKPSIMITLCNEHNSICSPKFSLALDMVSLLLS